MNVLLQTLFRELGNLPGDASFVHAVLMRAREHYMQGDFSDDSLLHTLDFLDVHYKDLFGNVVAAGKSKSEDRVVAEVQKAVAKLNQDNVPFVVYGHFLDRLLAFMGYPVENEDYQSLAGPLHIDAFRSLGAVLQNDADFAFSADRKTLKGYNGKSSVAIIPFGTASIDDGAFRNNGSVRYVVVPNSVRRIGSRAFNDCPNLAEVYLPSGITDIPDYMVAGSQGFHLISRQGIQSVGKYAFSGTNVPCGAMFSQTKFYDEGAFKHCPKVGALSFPADVRSIGKDAFQECSNLSEVTLPGKTSVGDGAFANNPNLLKAGVAFPNLGAGAFSNSGLAKLALGPGKVGDWAFNGCAKLASVSFNGDIEIGKEAFLRAPIPSLSFHAAKIGPSAFAMDKSLRKLSFTGQATIGPNAFRDCSSLQTVDFGPLPPFVADDAFAGCGLETLTLSQGAFKSGCFASNEKLREVNITSEAVLFKPGVFKGCSNIKMLLLPSFSNNEGLSYFGLFGRESFPGAVELSVNGDKYYSPKLERLGIAEIKPSQPLPSGAFARALRVKAAKCIPADLCVRIQGVEQLLIGPEVEAFDPSFDPHGATVQIDPGNKFIRHKDGLLLSPDGKEVKLILDPSSFRPETLKGFASVSKGVLHDLRISRLVIGSDGPLFATGAWQRCAVEELVIEDVSRLSPDAFQGCSAKKVTIHDASKAVPLGLQGKIEALETKTIDPAFLQTVLGQKVEVQSLTILDSTLNSGTFFGAKSVTLRRCALNGVQLHGERMESLEFEGCSFQGVSITGCAIGSLRLVHKDSKGLSFEACRIEQAEFISSAPVALDAFHGAGTTATITTFTVRTPKLLSTPLCLLDVETLRLDVAEIEDGALTEVHCTRIQLGPNLSKIGKEAFRECDYSSIDPHEQSCVYIHPQVPFLVDKNDGIAFVAFSKDVRSLLFGHGIADYHPSLLAGLKESIESVHIEDAPFFGMSSYGGMTHLRHVSCEDLGTSLSGAFPDSPIEEVELLSDFVSDHFLDYMDRLKKVTARKPLKALGENAFSNCASLREVPDMSLVETVGDFCFSGCSSLQRLSLPEAKSIGGSAFEGMLSLEELTLRVEGLGGSMLAAKFSMMGGERTKEVSLGEECYYVPATLRSIRLAGLDVPAFAFHGFEDCAIECLDPIEKAGEGAFKGCKSLRVDLRRLAIAGKESFAGTALTEAKLPEIVELHSRCFADTHLTYVHLGASLRQNELDAFEGNVFSSPEAIQLDPGAFFVADGCLCHKDELLKALPIQNYPESVAIGPTIRRIRERALSNLPSLRSLSLPSGVEVGENALDGLTGLESLEVAAGVTFVGPIVGAKNLRSLRLGATSFLKGKALSALLPDSAKLGEVRLSQEELCAEMFDGFDEISDLELATSSAKLPPKAISLPRLRRFVLAAPNLVSLPRDTMPLLEKTALRELDLSGCPKLGYGDFALAEASMLSDVHLAALSQPIREVFRSPDAFKDATVLIDGCPSLVPSMFEGLSGVRRLEIGRYGGSIPARAFAGVVGSMELSMPSPVEVGEEALFRFGGTLPQGFFQDMESIGPRAFVSAVCGDVDLPKLKRLGEEAFRSAHVTSFHIGKMLDVLGARALPNVAYEKPSQFGIAAPSATIDGSCVYFQNRLVHVLDYEGASDSLRLLGAEEICAGAFNGERVTPIRAVEVEGRTTVRRGAFENLVSLERLSLGEEVALERGAFSGCTGVRELYLGGLVAVTADELTEALGSMPEVETFTATLPLDAISFLEGFRKLTDLTLTLEQEDPGVFDFRFRAPKLRRVTLLGENLVGMDPNVFAKAPGVEELTLIDCPYLDPNLAFLSPLSQLKTLLVPNTAKPFSAYGKFPRLNYVAFGNCKKLVASAFKDWACPLEVHFLGAPLREIGDYAFSGVSKGVKLDSKELKGLRVIGSQAFLGGNIAFSEEATEFAEVKEIGERAFSEASFSSEVTFGSNDRLRIGNKAFAKTGFEKDVVFCAKAGGIDMAEGTCFEGASICDITFFGDCVLGPNCFASIQLKRNPKYETALTFEGNVVLGEACFAEIDHEIYVRLLNDVDIEGKYIFKGSKKAVVQCTKETAKHLDASHPEWRRHGKFGSAPNAFARFFRANLIKVETT
ncbi:MAG: leucine-rich repeat protein [Bacilli bacterium]|nr:leucine-rich repeat protein [Bacilli bacterium]